MSESRGYPLNAWYAAAWDVDVGRAPVKRTICDQSVVLYRNTSRAAVALEDACLHRLLPLSMGRVQGDNLVCGYHGMTFDATGRCVRMPIATETPSVGACIRSFPLIERHRLIWLWMGDPRRADPALVPDLHWSGDPEWAGEGSHFDMGCDYKLVLDNLMDLTHEAFVHSASLGHENLTVAPFEVEHDDTDVTLTRWMIDVDAPPFLAMQLKLAHGLEPRHVDRWQIIHFTAPSTIEIDVGVAPTGSGARQGDRSKGISGRVLNTVTPQSRGRCYYFFVYQRNFLLQDRGLTAEIRDANIRIFREDQNVLEAQQKAIDRMPDRRLLNLSIDKGSMWSRRAIERMIALEHGETTVVARREHDATLPV